MSPGLVEEWPGPTRVMTRCCAPLERGSWCGGLQSVAVGASSPGSSPQWPSRRSLFCGVSVNRAAGGAAAGSSEVRPVQPHGEHPAAPRPRPCLRQTRPGRACVATRSPTASLVTVTL